MLLHSVYDQPDADSVNAQSDRVFEGLYESSRRSPSTSSAVPTGVCLG